ncbi:uncharacterized protein PV07_07334 [Cladophialophora immunda]|uniref:Uncharacterized protein n=1 Tax=Cladophialophora immunda TaxID=569365 RepID=A0A0D2C926_9EURO|nr:uncharacterized protein PV07_07334 [Cladophialophora immunda]KIW27608.1 hypothetical protein PV07_07334 [Cladophialophora immunda]OQU97338.1 hypothetical protein CLAIMM_03284 [Cladophialophora immunda]
MAILSEIVRFVLPPTKARLSAFLKLRQQVSQSCNIHDQYFGYVIPVKSSHLRVKENEMCWVIHWPQGSSLAQNAELRAQLKELTTAATSGQAGEATSLLFPFDDSQVGELKKALEAPVCEFAIINLTPNPPRADPSFVASMHKTYTDCYHFAGFAGGNWAYAANTNDTAGVGVDGRNGLKGGVGDDDDAASAGRREEVPEDERRLACYYLGWDTVEHHQEYSNTPLFFEEINKLAPYFGSGTGAWYVRFEKHSDSRES